MDRQLFKKRLSESLKKHGVNGKDIKAYLSRFDDLSDEDFQSERITDEDIEATVNELLSPKQIKTNTNSNQELNLNEIFLDNSTDINNNFEQEFDFPDFEADNHTEKIVYDEEANISIQEIEIGEKSLKKVKKKKKPNNPKVKGTPLFWTLFATTLPITVPAIVILCVFVALLYVIVTFLIVLAAVTTIAIIAAGTALALIGIIYGITLIGKHQTPIGLYEIGVGIATGGVSMLLSVFLYNVSVRVLPKLYKCVKHLTLRIFKYFSGLYFRFKKECGK